MCRILMHIFLLLGCREVAAQLSFQAAIGTAGDEQFHAVIARPDGRYLVAGEIQLPGRSDTDILLACVDLCGQVHWAWQYGGPEHEAALALSYTPDGGQILTGFTRSEGNGSRDLFILKSDSLGQVQWQTAWGGDDYDAGLDIAVLASGYVCIGESKSIGAGASDLLVAKLDLSGQLLWGKTLGASLNERGVKVRQANNLDLIIVGSTRSYNNLLGALMVRLNSGGTVRWIHTYQGFHNESAHDLWIDAQQNLIVAGTSTSFGAGGEDAWLFSTNASGDYQWGYAYGAQRDEHVYAMQPTADGGYVLGAYQEQLGNLDHDFLMLRTDAQGQLLWSQAYGGNFDEAELSELVHPGLATRAGQDFLLVGHSEAPGLGGRDAYLMRTDSMGQTGGCREHVAPLQQISVTAQRNLRNMTETSLTAFRSLSLQATPLSLDLAYACPLPDPDLIQDLEYCQGDMVWLDATLPGADSYRWQDGLTDARRPLLQGGTYQVAVQLGGCTFRDTAVVIRIDTVAIDLGGDQTLCTGDSVRLSVSEDPLAQYRWQNGHAEPQLWVSQPGDYRLEVKKAGCTARDQVKVLGEQLPAISLGPDTTLCEGQQLHFSLVTRLASLHWQDGTTGGAYTLSQPGQYVVQARTYACETLLADTLLVQVEDCNCLYFLASAFTPNGDGLNESIGPVGICQAEQYVFQIYNRWGRLVFESRQPDQVWNGYSQGQPQPQGVYFWGLQYQFLDARGRRQYRRLQGSITLLR